MKNKLFSANIIAATISLFVIAGCGGGGGGGSGAFDADGEPGGNPPGTFDLITSDAEASALTGPLLYQTGDTVMGGMETIVGFGFGSPPVFINTDPSSNTISDDFGGSITPEVIYDDLGRGIQIDNLVIGAVAPIITVAYNDDNTIASTSQTTRDGDVRIQTDFIYEDGRLTGKEETGVGFTRTVTYSYTEDGMLASGTKSLFIDSAPDQLSDFVFTVDSQGRVIEAMELDIEDNVVRDATITFDAGGNIVAIEDFQDFTGIATQTNSTWDYTASAEPTVNLFGFFAAINDLFIPVFTNNSFGVGE